MEIKMKKIIILGSTGLLGNALGEYFISKEEYKTLLTYRNKSISYGKNKFYYDPLTNFNLLKDYLYDTDYVINCIGIIIPFISNKKETIRLNSLFPYLLSDLCRSTKTRLIHITTDCVFSGKKGLYTEEDLHDATDFYGKSKSLGEPDNCMVLRTSIIGREIHKKASLIEWAFSMHNQEVNGFSNHIWNGITTQQYAKCCDTIISNNLYKESIFHIFSNIITKYELINLFNSKWNLNLKINPFETSEHVDRTLSTVKELNEKLGISNIEKQIEEIE